MRNNKINNPIFQDFALEAVNVGGYPIQTFKYRFPNLWAMFDKSVSVYKDMPYIKEGQNVFSYQQVRKDALSMAKFLQNYAGVSKGDNVAILMETSIRFIISFWGIQRLGATAVVLNTRLSPPELKRQLGASDLKLLISSTTLEPKLKEIPDLSVSIPNIILDENWRQKLLKGEIQGDVPEILEDDTAVILFTSGTSGVPKGVMMTHRNLITNSLKKLASEGPYDGPDNKNMLIVAPLFHVLALSGQLLPASLFGRCCILMPQFKAPEVLDVIVRERVSFLSGSPTMYWMLLNKTNIREMKLNHLKFINYGGAPMSPDLLKDIRKTFPGVACSNGYGMTEASQMARLTDEFCDTHPTSVGKPSLCSEIKIVDPETATELGPNCKGEIVTRGANVFKGYYNQPDLTAEVFRAGWLHSGDTGYMDSDGFLYPTGRVKEMINRGGENVFPVEVENVVALHSKILDCSVFGLPDPVMGSVVAVAVVLKSPEDTIDIKELKKYCAERLADYKIPTKMFVVQELPRNPGGKVMKTELIKEFNSLH